MRSKEKIYEEFLVASARLGDQRALDALIRHRGPKLFSYACGLMGNRDEAADIVQEAWLEIIRGLGNLREPRAFSTWAYRIVSRRCAKMIDHNVKHRKIAQIQPEISEPINDDQSAARAIRDAINQLPLAQAATIRLFYLEGFSVQEIAMALDAPVGTIKSRLSRARQTLKTTLKGDEDV